MMSQNDFIVRLTSLRPAVEQKLIMYPDSGLSIITFGQ